MAGISFEKILDPRGIILSLSFSDNLWRYRGFYQYYQISRGDEDNQADESESSGGDELKSEGFHSVFGFVAVAMEKLGMSREEVLKTPFALINIMLADTPKLKKTKKQPKKFASTDELAQWLGAEEIEN